MHKRFRSDENNYSSTVHKDTNPEEVTFLHTNYRIGLNVKL